MLLRAGVIEEGDTIDVEEALNDELIEEINDWDRAEVEAAAEEYAGGSSPPEHGVPMMSAPPWRGCSGA